MANRTKLTAEKKDEFLTALSDTANVTRAAEKIGMSRRYMYEVRDTDEEFKKEWQAAETLGLDALEDEVTRRGVEGWEEPVWYQGVQCGLVRKFSDSLLMFRLNGGRPEKYRQRVSAEHTGKNGEPLAPAIINIGFANGGPGEPSSSA